MASLRRTRRFSSSPTPPGRQHHDRDPYYSDDSRILDIPAPSSASQGHESSKFRTESRSRSVRKNKSQPAVKSSHMGLDGRSGTDEHRAASYSNRGVARDVSPSVIESSSGGQRRGRTSRSQSIRPRDANAVEDALSSRRAPASGNDVERTPDPSNQSSLFLAPKSKNRSRSRPPSPMPSHPPHNHTGDDYISIDPQNYDPTDVSLRLHPKSRRTGASRSRSKSSSETGVTRKLHNSAELLAPSSRVTSPLSPLSPTLNDHDSSSGTSRLPSPAVQISSRASSTLSPLPSSTRKESSKNQIGDTQSRLPSRARSRSRTPHSSNTTAPHTLRDVTRLLEENRGSVPGRNPSYLDDSLPQQFSPNSTPVPSRKQTLHEELDRSTLSTGADANQMLVERSRQAMQRYGLALTNENGHILGESPVEETQISQLRSTRRGTTPEILSPLHSVPDSLKRSLVSGPDFSMTSSERSNRSTAIHHPSSSGNILQYEQDKVPSQASARDNSNSAVNTSHSGDRSWSRTILPIHETRSMARQDWRQGPGNHVHASGTSHPDPTTASAQLSSPPTTLPRSVPRPILVSRQQSTSVRPALPSILIPRPPRTEISLSRKPGDSDTSSSSLPRPRKLAIRNPDPEDLLSSPSSNPRTPKSTIAANSEDFTILALSGSQTSMGQTNEIDYVVPDEVAAEVANDEERRRKALAGLVHDLHLTNGKERAAREHQIASRSRAQRDIVVPRRESHYHHHEDDDEEDDDAFFARLSMHNDEGSLLEEPEPEADGFIDYDEGDFDEEHSDFDGETESEEEEDEDPPLPPTPKFVHPLGEGDDLESRITRVTSLNRISPTPIVSPSHGLGQGRQLRSLSGSPATWKAMGRPSIEDASLRVRTIRVASERGRSGSDRRVADTPEAQDIDRRHESFKRREVIEPPLTEFIREDEASSSQTHDSISVTDNELSLVTGGRLLGRGSGTEETLSSGAEALFRQLQVEAEAQDAVDVRRGKNAASDQHFRSERETANITHKDHLNLPAADRHPENQNVPLVRPHEPILLRTWRSTLPFGAYDSLAERHGPSEMRRQEIIWELCETEQAFVKSLRLILRLFVQPLRHEDKAWIPGVPRDVTRLFDWFDDIMQLHSQISSALHAARSSQYPVVIQIAETLRPFVPRLELHQPYLVKLESVSSAIEAMGKDINSDFGEFVRIQTASPECESMNLPSFLLKPVQRLMKYPLFFKQLWELTPRSHPDHLPTFSLLHSTDMIIRVMQEVKAREEEYELVKNLASRIKGLPPGYHLARRERRLVAQGVLRRVVLSDKERLMLETTTEGQTNQRSQAPSPRMTSASSNNSSFAGDWTYHPTKPGNMETFGTDRSLHAESTVSDASLDSTTNVSRSNSRTTSRSRSSSLRGSLRHKLKESSVYAFVFTDLVILTTPMSERMHLLRSPKNTNDGKETWKLIDGVGVSRVLGVTDQSGQLSNYEHLIVVELMSMTPDILDSGAIYDRATATPMYLSIPGQRVSSAEDSHDACAEARAKWLDAFERCFRFTLRSLSFPSYAGKYGTNANGGSTDLELDTKSSVMSILSSGLPLPMSPSQQLDEAQRGRPTDPVQEEREERGWWSLRFHQVLKEVQRSSRSPVLDAAPSRKSDTRGKLQGEKRSEPRPLILSPNPSITITSTRKGGFLSLGRKKSN